MDMVDMLVKIQIGSETKLSYFLAEDTFNTIPFFLAFISSGCDTFKTPSFDSKFNVLYLCRTQKILTGIATTKGMNPTVGIGLDGGLDTEIFKQASLAKAQKAMFPKIRYHSTSVKTNHYHIGLVYYLMAYISVGAPLKWIVPSL